MYVNVILPKLNNIKALKARMIGTKINKVAAKKKEKLKLLSSVASQIIQR